MIVNSKSKKALKGFIEYTLVQYKKLFIIAAVVLMLLTLENVLYTVSCYCKFLKNSSDVPYVGMSIGTSYGYFVIIGILTIYIFFTATKKKVNQSLKLPLNREVFAVGNFVSLLTSALILMLMLLSMILIEGIFGNILSTYFKDVILVNEVTIKNFIEGLWVSLSCMVLAGSVAYCLGIYFFRHTIVTVIVLTIVISFISLFPTSLNLLLGVSSLTIFSIIVWLLTILVHVVSYFPLRKMEVTV